MSAFLPRRWASKGVLLVWLVAANLCHAAAISWTGAELLSDPRVSFPGQTPTLDGDSLVYGTSSVNFQKLVEISLIGPGAISPGDAPTQISITVSLTRLTDDWDPHIGIGDGNQMLVALPTDNGFVAAEELLDLGASGDRQRQVFMFNHSGLPGIGGTVDMTLDFLLGDGSSSFSTSFLGGSGTYDALVPLDRTAGLNVVLARDNDTSEQYEINSVSVNSELLATVPEPQSGLLILTALGCLGFARSRIGRVPSVWRSGSDGSLPPPQPSFFPNPSIT